MMSYSCRKPGDNNCSQEFTRTRSHYRKPPSGNWQPTVPSWEKKYCTLVGSVPWRKLVETKRCMHLYENVVKWNDSAGEEAFQNAKNRFYAYLHGLPCDLPLPDPNLYIDEVNWDSNIDPELILDLECQDMPPCTEDNERVISFGNSFYLSKGFSISGWGDNDFEEPKKPTNVNAQSDNNSWVHDQSLNRGATEWGDCGKNNFWCHEESNDGDNKDNGRKNSWNNSPGWNKREDTCYKSDGVKNHIGRSWGGGKDFNNMGREGQVRYLSRYKTSRFQGDENQRNRSWRQGSWRKKIDFASENPIAGDKPDSG